MKSRKLLVAILVIALLAVYYLLGTDYLKQRRDNEALASQVIVEKDTLAQIPQPPADLDSQLSEAEAQLEDARNVFPEKLNSTSVIESILRLSDDVGIRAIPLVTQPWTTEPVEGNSYSILRLHLTVTGTFEKTTEFLSQLENGDLNTLVMEYFTIDSLETPFGGDVAQIDMSRMVNSVFEIAVYSQPPVIIEPEQGEKGLEE